MSAGAEELSDSVDILYNGIEDLQEEGLVEDPENETEYKLEIAANFDEDEDESKSGEHGDDLTWTLKDGTLTFSETGEMWRW